MEDTLSNDTIFARSTRGGVAAGVNSGFEAAISSMVVKMKKQLGKNTTVLLTGGDASELADLTRDLGAQVDHTLLFSGLRFLDN